MYSRQIAFVEFETDGALEDEEKAAIKEGLAISLHLPLNGKFGSPNCEVPQRRAAETIVRCHVVNGTEEHDVIPGCKVVGLLGRHVRDVACFPVFQGLLVDHQLPLVITADRKQGRGAGSQAVELGRRQKVHLLK